MGLNGIVNKILRGQMCLLFESGDSFAVKWEKLSQPFCCYSSSDQASRTRLVEDFYLIKN